MKHAACLLVAFACVLLVSLGCSGPDDCRLGALRCNRNVIEHCEINLVEGHWVPFRDCSAYDEVCTNDAALCAADRANPPCCL